MAEARANPADVLDAGRSPEAGRSTAPLVAHPLPVAILAPTVAALAFASYPPGAQAVLAAFVAAVLIVLAATDIERRIIPNRIVLPAAAIVLVAHVAIVPERADEFIVAALVGGLFFLVPNLISSSLMGMGDVKLVVLLGAALGWGVIGAVTIAFLSVFPVAVFTLVRGGLAARKATLPFGPFLALGGLTILIVPHLAGLG